MPVTLDIESHADGLFWALLTTENGVFDVYGESLAELKNEALLIAESLGVEIDCFNLDLPEA